MIPEPPTPRSRTGSPQRRAEVVAGIRALADLIETNLDIPVPNSVRSQHSLISPLTDDGVALVQATAAALGVEADVNQYDNVEPGGVTHRADASIEIAHGYTPDDGSFSVTYTLLGLTRQAEAGESA